MNKRIADKLEAVPHTKPGPKTEDAKNRIRSNAYTHGLTAQMLIIPPEEQPAYDRIAAGFRQRFQVADDFEDQLLQKIIDTNWRLEICASVESALYTMVPWLVRREPPKDDRVSFLKERARAFEGHADKFNLLGRYEAGLDRRFRAMLAELEAAIQKRSKTAHPEHVPEPAPASTQPPQTKPPAPSNDLFRQPGTSSPAPIPARSAEASTHLTAPPERRTAHTSVASSEGKK